MSFYFLKQNIRHLTTSSHNYHCFISLLLELVFEIIMLIDLFPYVFSASLH